MIDKAASFTITLALVAPGLQELVPLEVQPGTTVAEALARSGLIEHYRIDLATVTVGVHGRRVAPDSVVHPGDRIELCRPLRFDPKEARRRRARHAANRRSDPR